MQIAKLKALLPDLDAEGIEVNPTEQLEQYFFRRPAVIGVSKDYRNEAIDFSIANRVALFSTTNNVYNMAERFLTFKCHCGKQMQQDGGGGNSAETVIHFKCECGDRGYLAIPVGGISLEFKSQGKEE